MVRQIDYIAHCNNGFTMYYGRLEFYPILVINTYRFNSGLIADKHLVMQPVQSKEIFYTVRCPQYINHPDIFPDYRRLKPMLFIGCFTPVIKI